MKQVLSIGEILIEYFLQGNAPLAVAYRKRKPELLTEHESALLAKRKPEVAGTVTFNEKGGKDAENRI